MTLYFKNSRGKRKKLATFKDKSVVFDLINADVRKRNPDYKIYYTRTWRKGNETYFDVGSWTELYILVED